MGCNCGKKKYEVVTAHQAEERRVADAAAQEQARVNAAASAKMQQLRDAENMRQARINAGG